MILKFKDLSDFPSLNVIMREHFMVAHKRKNKLIMLIKAQAMNGYKFKGKVEITYTRYAVRYMDWDNFGASFKFIGDAIRDCGIIVDDKPSIVVNFIPKQVKVSKKSEEQIVVKIADFIEEEESNLFKNV